MERTFGLLGGVEPCKGGSQLGVLVCEEWGRDPGRGQDPGTAELPHQGMAQHGPQQAHQTQSHTWGGPGKMERNTGVRVIMEVWIMCRDTNCSKNKMQYLQ